MSAAPEVCTRAKHWIFLGVALLLGVALVPLYFFNPIEHGFYPKCMLHSLTGLDCPGCGGLRAVHQLLHGHLVRAFQFNPLFICLLPLGAWWFLRWVMQKYFDWAWANPFQNTKWPWLLGGGSPHG